MNVRLYSMLAAGMTLLSLAIPVHAQETKKSPFAKWEPSIQAFEKQDAEQLPQPGQILFIGSSSIRLWDLPKWFPDLSTINRGFGGSEVADSVHFYDRIVKPYQPRTIVMYAGDNDLAHGKSPAAVLDDFKEFVNKVQTDFPDTKIVYVAVKPSLRRWNLIEQVRKTNDFIAKLAEDNAQVVFLDIDTPMIGQDGTPKPELFVKDGLHLSDDGYQLWSNLLRPHLTDVALQDVRFQPQRDIYDAYHPWVPPTQLEDWKQAAAKIKRQILVSNGLWPMPEKTPLNAVVYGRIDRGDHTVEKVYIRSRPGHYVTGNLYRPKEIKGKVPGILCPHGHWANGRFYDAGDGAKAQLESGAEEFESGAHSPLQARMVQLARMGCVVFHYDMIGYADSQPLDHRTGFNDADAALRLHNLMGLQTWNSIRCLDFLESLDEVDPQRLAVTGASGGGTQTMILAAIDPRIAAAFPAVMVSTGMQGGCVCENASYLRHDVNNVAFAALFAPKPQAMSGADDWTIAIETKGLPELKQIYSLYGRPDLVDAQAFPQFKHNYNQVAREVMYNWFNEHLQLGIEGPVKQTDFQPLSQAEMAVFNEEHPLPQDALQADSLRELMTQEDRQELQSWVDQDEKTYVEIVGGAAQVMLAPEQPAASFIRTSTRTIAGDVSVIQGVVTHPQGVAIPTILLSSASKPKGTVFWFDTAGATHLLMNGEAVTPEVSQLLNAGYQVISADLYLTGTATGSGKADFEYQVNDKYPGYTYCYNRPLISERVRDILAVTDAFPLSDQQRRLLIGTGAAGVWTLLARTVLPANSNTGTIVDLQKFSFAEIDSIAHPNLLPGALKYGGLAGLTRLIPASNVQIYGVADPSAFLQILKGSPLSQAQPTLSAEKLERGALVEKITASTSIQ